MYKNRFAKIYSGLANRLRNYMEPRAIESLNTSAKYIRENPSFYLGDNLDLEEMEKVLYSKGGLDKDNCILDDPLFHNVPFDFFTITGSTEGYHGRQYAYITVVTDTCPESFYGPSAEELCKSMDGESKLFPKDFFRWRISIMVEEADGRVTPSFTTYTCYVANNGLLGMTPCSGDMDIPTDELIRTDNYNQFGMFTVFYLLKLLSCKNVIIKDETVGKKGKPNPKRPELDYKTIHIKTPRTIIHNDKEYDTIPFHERDKFGVVGQRMGHFKTYTEEKPLLGKHVGTWWWSPIFNVKQANDYSLTK